MEDPAKNKSYFPKISYKLGKTDIFLISVIIGIFLVLPLLTNLKSQGENQSPQDLTLLLEEKELVCLQGNTVFPVSAPINPEPSIVKKLNVVVTAYSSSVWETDSNPYKTASGNMVKEGIVANNLLPFGTKIKIPEIYGDKVFTVEDRMHWRKGYYHVDIWFPSYWEALNFGAKRTYVEILEG